MLRLAAVVLAVLASVVIALPFLIGSGPGLYFTAFGGPIILLGLLSVVLGGLSRSRAPLAIWSVFALFLGMCLTTALVFAASYWATARAGDRICWSDGSLQVVTGFWELLYFSVVTLMTLGYGDIFPCDPVPRSLAGAEVVMFWLFVTCAVLILQSRWPQRTEGVLEGMGAQRIATDAPRGAGPAPSTDSAPS